MALFAPASTIETTCVEAAPIAIWAKPVMPAAAPAACGRTLTRASDGVRQQQAVAVGDHQLRQENDRGAASGMVATSSAVRLAPVSSNAMPAMIMASTPKRCDSREAVKLPLI